MKFSTKIFPIFIHCLWTGLTLMCLALFLHPMNPEDFLALAISEPLRTLRETHGIQAAILFWASVALTATGIAGLIRSMKYFFKYMSQQRRLGANAKPDNMEENWSFL